MGWIGATVAVLMIAIVLIDAFEVMILPRRVRRSFRLARMIYVLTWRLWLALAQLLPVGRRRQSLLSVFGPLSLFALIGVWAVGLVGGFALIHWSMRTAVAGADGDFGSYLYFSNTTFFTLGYGDLVPTGRFSRFLSMIEVGLGLIFLAVVVSYLPVLYQAFSRREITISLLDARAGSPPTAGELLRRLGEAQSLASVGSLLVEWERWAAELLESHMSFPVLGYYRSQHENQSWVAALAAILDTSALIIAGVDGPHQYQVRLTFAMARHAAVDLAMILKTPPPATDRLPLAELERLLNALRIGGLDVREGVAVAKALAELRGLYEPFLHALASYYMFALPPFMPNAPPVDNWQTSAWMQRSPSLSGLPAANLGDNHFD
jgi:hypothetical protein